MGATFSYFITNNTDRDNILKEYNDYCDAVSEEYGSSYSGELNMTSGVEIDHSVTYPSIDQAVNYLETNTEKWGPALAVPYRDGDTIKFVIGGICAS